MEKEYFKRLQISVLSIIAFLGLMCHTLMFAVKLPVNIAQGLNLAPEINEMLRETGGSVDGMLWMLFVFFLVALLPAFIPLVTNARWGRWLAFITAVLMALMNILDGFAHIFAEGEVPQGLVSLIVGGFVGVVVSMLALRWARE